LSAPAEAGASPKRDSADGRGGVVAIVPAFDEAGRIAAVIESARRFVDAVIVVDDGSRDGTARIAAAAGAEVVPHAARRGKGAAVRTGLAAVRDRGYEYILLLDGDGQHDPAETPRLLDAARRRGFDIVVGHRLSDPSAHNPVRYYTNLVACNMLSRWIGHEVLDSQSGFRLIRAGALDGVDLDARGFEIETEMLLKLCRRGASVGYVEVHGGAPSRRSRLRPVRDVTRICLSAVKYRYLVP